MLSYKDLKFPKPPNPPAGGRPYVIVEMVMSLDGKTRSGKFWPIGSAIDKRLMAELELRSDMVMQGAGTVRIWHGKIRLAGDKAFATITLSGRIGKLIKPTVIYASKRTQIQASGDYEIVRIKTIRQMLEDIRNRGVKLLLVEGGAILNWHLFKENLVDELFLTIAPKIFGGRDYKSIVDGKQYPLPRQGRLVSVCQQDSELFLRYTFDK